MSRLMLFRELLMACSQASNMPHLAGRVGRLWQPQWHWFQAPGTENSGTYQEATHWQHQAMMGRLSRRDTPAGNRQLVLVSPCTPAASAAQQLPSCILTSLVAMAEQRDVEPHTLTHSLTTAH
jgi:hypothetical protein